MIMLSEGSNYTEVFLQPDASLLQKVFLQGQHHLPARELEVADLRKFRSEAFVQIVELAVSSGDYPSCGGHLVSSAAAHFDDIYKTGQGISSVLLFKTPTHGELLPVWLGTDHDGLDEDGGASVQAVVALLDYVLLPLQFFPVDLALEARFGFS